MFFAHVSLEIGCSEGAVFFFEFHLRDELGTANVTLTSSADLQRWPPVDPAAIESVQLEDGVWEMRVQAVPATSERRFFRLEVD